MEVFGSDSGRLVTVIFDATVMQLVAGLAVLCVLTAIGFYVVSSFRDYGDDDLQVGVDELANLREMHRRGDINDEEFRTIQARTQRSSDSPAADPSIADRDTLPGSGGRADSGAGEIPSGDKRRG